MRKVLGVVAIFGALTLVGTAQVRGHIIVSGATRPDILVSLVTHNGQIVRQAFTGARGQFELQGVTVTSLRSDNPVYLVIDEEGYEPHRQLLLQSDLRSGGLNFAIYLKEEAGAPAAPRESRGTVDVVQLQFDPPEGAREAYDRALETAEDGDHSQAIERLEFAVTLAPDYYDAWLELGAQYDRLDRAEAAREAYLEASTVNPGGAVAYLNVGALDYRHGDLERVEGHDESSSSFLSAREWLEKAIQLDPTSSAAGFYLGATLYRLENYPEAEEWLQRAIQMDGGHAVGARSMLINVYTRQRRYVAAHEQAVMFLEEFPGAAETETIQRVKAQLEARLGI